MSDEPQNIKIGGAGISRTTFVAGLIVAILASSVLSTVVAMTVIQQGPEGPQGPVGPEGAQGPPGRPIVFATSWGDDMLSTTETINFVDMANMTVTLTITETSDVLILVSVVALPGWDENILIRALINGAVARPGEVWLTPVISDLDYGDSYFLGWGSYTYNFYQLSVNPGTYTIKVQWMIFPDVGATRLANILQRSLTVMALPA